MEPVSTTMRYGVDVPLECIRVAARPRAAVRDQSRITLFFGEKPALRSR